MSESVVRFALLLMRAVSRLPYPVVRRLGEFAGSLDTGDLGYLNGSVPVGFVYGSQLPESEAYVDSLADITFYYTKRASYEIAPGEISRVMFICSDYAPGQIIGNQCLGVEAPAEARAAGIHETL